MTPQSPSSLELMQYADGELEPQRAREIEQWLAESSEGRAIVATFDELGRVVREHAHGSAAAADDIADQVMTRLEAGQGGDARVVPLRQARGQAGMVAYAAGALALAAAAALLVWRIAGPSISPQALNAPSARPSQSGAELAMAPTNDPEDREPGVSVDAIEFGAHAGTIFYVPSDTGTTTVVWLTDDDTGEGR